MSIAIRRGAEIDAMRAAGQAAAQVLEMIEPFVKAGVSTNELNDRCHDFIVETLDATPAPLHYNGFPKSICTSINHVVCHGIPSVRKLKTGDILNIDTTVIKNGWHGDTSKMFIIGGGSVKAKRICRVARECLEIGIAQVKPGNRLGKIGGAIEAHARKNRCSVVRDYCGHGIGDKFHDEPQVIHYDNQKIDQSPVLETGMIFTIEPMINLGGFEVKTSKQDGWTVTTKDRSLSAQWEHTILVTDDGAEILTQLQNQNAVSSTNNGNRL